MVLNKRLYFLLLLLKKHTSHFVVKRKNFHSKWSGGKVGATGAILLRTKVFYNKHHTLVPQRWGHWPVHILEHRKIKREKITLLNYMKYLVVLQVGSVQTILFRLFCNIVIASKKGKTLFFFLSFFVGTIQNLNFLTST